MFVSILLIAFMLMAAISFLDREKDGAVIGAYVCIGAVLVLIAGLRPIGVDADSEQYVEYYNSPDPLLVEPLFIGIADTLRNLFDTPRALFFLYALMSIPLKMFAFTRLTNLWYLTVLIWMSHFFIMQDCTQIRCAVATAIYLFALYYLLRAERGWCIRYRLPYVLLILLAANFHISALVLLPLVVFGNSDLTRGARLVLAAVPIVGYGMYFLHLDPITMVPLPFIQDKLDIYEELRDSGMAGDDINVFNILYLVKLTAYYLLLWKYELVKEHTRILPLFLKLYACSYFCFTAFSGIPVIAYRIGEIIGVVDILLFPLLIYTVRPQWAGKALVLVFAFSVMLLNIFHNELLDPTL